MRRHDEALAERLARSTLAATRRLSAAMVVAHACMEQGRAADALEALHDPTIDLATAGPTERVRAAVLEANVHFWGLGRADAAAAVLGPLTGAAAGASQHPDVEGTLATIAAFSGHPTEALTLAGIDGTAAPNAFATMAARIALVAAGRPATAAALPDPPGVADPTLGSLLGIARAQSLVMSGRIAEAADWAIEQWEEATRARAAHRRVGWSVALADAEHAAGRLASARRWYEDAARQAVVSGANLHGRRWAISGALLCAAQLGEVAAATELAQQLDSLPPHDATVHEVAGGRGRAWLLAQRQDVDGAVDLLEQLLLDAAAAGRHGHVVEFATDIARLDRPDRAVELLDRTDATTRLDGDYLPLMVAAVRAFARHDPVGLGEAAEGFHAIGAGLLAAEAAGGAAALAGETGEDHRTVAARQRRAVELRALIDGLATPSAAAAPVELPLSRREREIATLVAEGRTSREVAEHLVIGVRTVESHLGRVFGKLGISSRSELAEALGLTGAFTSAAGAGGTR
jgi:DNA-binding CsgD family transcriptional regulator